MLPWLSFQFFEKCLFSQKRTKRRKKIKRTAQDENSDSVEEVTNNQT